MIEQLSASGTPIAEAIVPILAAIDDPPTAPLSARAQGEPIDLAQEAFDPDAARRIDALLRELLAPHLSPGASAYPEGAAGSR